ncbi:MAG: hypothetical protein NC099_02485 [Corallococcus sp.]|nr:hypothetical protein [Bacillota bacterium]MCM1533500.1 hypothetical protein [Corallococcus sp.]
MRKLIEKVVLIVQICITMVFAITTILNLTDVFPDGTDAAVIQSNRVLTSLIYMLFILYVGLSAYMIYVNFSEREILKKVLLFCDSESATHTNVKVINKIVFDCARKSEGIAVRKIKIRADDKQGFAITLKVNVNADSLSETIDTFRCMLYDSFVNILGLKFNSINFEVNKLNTRYAPDAYTAEEKAKQLGNQRELTTEIYNEPLDNDIELDELLKADEPHSNQKDERE